MINSFFSNKYELYEDVIRYYLKSIITNNSEEKSFDFGIEHDPLIEKESLLFKKNILLKNKSDHSHNIKDPLHLYVLGKKLADEEHRELSQTFYEQAQKIFLKKNDLQAVAFCFLRMGENEWVLNNLSKTEEYYQNAYDLFKNDQNNYGKAYSLRALARIKNRLGKHKESEQYYLSSLEIFQDLQFDHGMATIFLGLADNNFDFGKLNEARRLYKKALHLYQKEGDKKQTAYALKGLGMTEHELGNHEKSHIYLTRSLNMFKEFKDLRGEGKVLRAFGNLEFTFGKIESAYNYYITAFDIFKKFNNIRWMTFILRDMSELEMLRGHYQKAEELLNQASILIKKIDNTKIKKIESHLLSSMGNLALHRGHYEQAEMLYNKSIDIDIDKKIGNDHEMAKTMESYAFLEQKKGIFKKAENLLEKALNLFSKCGNQKNAATIYLKKGMLKWLQGQYTKSIKDYTRAKDISAKIECSDIELQASFGIGCCLFFMGETKEANSIFLETVEKLKKITTPIVQAQIFQELEYFKCFMSEHETALEYAEKSKEIYEQLNNNQGICSAISIMGNIECMRGNFSKAKEFFKKAYEKSEGSNFFPEAYSLRGFGDIAFSEGKNEEALKFYEKSLKIFESLNCALGLSSIYRRFGEVLLVLGNESKALIYFNKSLDISTHIKNLSESATTLYGLGKLEKSRKNYHNALDYYEKSKDIFTKIGFKYGIAKAFYGIGTLAHHGVDQESARESLNQSVLMAHEINDVVTEGEAFLELCRIDENSGRFGPARINCGNALKLFTKSNHALDKLKARLAYADLEILSDHNIETIRTYKNCLEISKKIGNQECEVKSLIGIATVDFFKDNFEEARQVYKKVLDIVKDNKSFFHEKIKVLLKLGELEGSLGNFDLARIYYENAFVIATEIKCEPDQISILRHQGRLETKAKNFKEALSFYNKSMHLAEHIERQQDVAKVLYNIGSLHLKINDPTEALIYFIKAQMLFNLLDDAWRDALAWRGIGKAQLKMSHFNEAQKAFERAISLFRDSHIEICETRQYIWILENNPNFKGKKTIFFEDVVTCFRQCHSKRRYAKFLEKAASIKTNELSNKKRINLLKEALSIFKELKDKEKTKNALILIKKIPQINNQMN